MPSMAEQQHQAQRWTYIGSGMSHPNFLGTVQKLSPTSAERLTEIAPALCWCDCRSDRNAGVSI